MAQEKARILIALGLCRKAVILATDSAWVEEEVDSISPDPDDIGILAASDYEHSPGIYLWEGTLSTVMCGSRDSPEPETRYEGAVRPVYGREISHLLDTLRPPTPPLHEETDHGGQPPDPAPADDRAAL